VPSAKDVQALIQRVDELSQQIQKTPAKAVKAAAPASKKAVAVKAPVAKSAAKSAVKVVVKRAAPRTTA
jgi:hypothetical protein